MAQSTIIGSSSLSAPSSGGGGGMAELSNGGFCVGPGYAMEAGFQPGFGTTNYCVLLFFSGWNVNSKTKYAWTLVAMFCLGFLIEVGSYLRKKLSAKIVAGGSAAFSDEKQNGDGRRVRRRQPPPPVSPYIHYSSCLLYGCQMTVAYLVMLAVMLYETYIFCCLIAGLVVGHGIFTVWLPRRAMYQAYNEGQRKNDNQSNNRIGIHGGEEEDEQQLATAVYADDGCECSGHSPCCSPGAAGGYGAVNDNNSSGSLGSTKQNGSSSEPNDLALPLRQEGGRTG